MSVGSQTKLLGDSSKTVSFNFDEQEMDNSNSWANYDACSEKSAEALSRNCRMRKHFSVIEVPDDDSELEVLGSHQRRNRAFSFFTNSHHHGRHKQRKSVELKVIESADDEPSSPISPTKDGFTTNANRNGIWGLQSHKVDIKNLHPEVGELLEAASLGNNEKINDILKDKACMRISNKGDLNVTDLLGRSALHLAVYNNHLHTAKLLINQGAKIDMWDSQKMATPLICAAAIGKVPLIQLLLESGADVNCGYERGTTALLWAARSGSVECLEKLLEAGAHLDAPMMYSETPLHVSCARGDVQCAKLLLKNGADVNLRQGEQRNTPLHLSAQEFSTECCELLLDNGATLDAPDMKGRTPLHVSVLSCDVETTQLFLSRGADVSVKDSEERTPLFFAIDKDPRAVECVQLLLTHNAAVNCQDHMGLSPLHISAIKESKKCAALLINHNANVALESKAGVSALSLMLRKIPDTMTYIKNHLNDGVTVIRDTNDSSCKVKLNFRTLVPSGGGVHTIRASTSSRKKPGQNKETEVIKSFIRAGQQNILLHPLIEAFLTLKWQKMRKFFYLGIVLKVLLAFLFSVFLVRLYVSCPEPPADVIANLTKVVPTDNGTMLNLFETYESNRVWDNDTQETTTPKAIETKAVKEPPEPYVPIELCFQRSEWIAIWSLVVCLSLILICQELLQMMQSFTTYMWYIESWVFWLFIIHVGITCTFLPRDGSKFVKTPWQQSFAAISVFLAWIFILIQLGKFPTAGTLVQMFVKVFANFGRFFAAYSCFLMGFTLAFCILFQPDDPKDPFKNPLTAFAKVIRIMTGDVNQEAYMKDLKGVRFWVSQIFHAVFVTMVTIVLMNLLVGLAVADIQGMYRDAKLHRLSRQATLVFHLESSFLSSAVLKRIPISCAASLKRHILVLPFCLNGNFIIRPYDYRDIRLPEDLKLSFLKLSNSSVGESGNANLKENDSFSDLQNNSNSSIKDLEQKVSDMKHQLDYLIEKIDKYYSVNTSQPSASE